MWCAAAQDALHCSYAAAQDAPQHKTRCTALHDCRHVEGTPSHHSIVLPFCVLAWFAVRQLESRSLALQAVLSRRPKSVAERLTIAGISKGYPNIPSLDTTWSAHIIYAVQLTQLLCSQPLLLQAAGLLPHTTPYQKPYKSLFATVAGHATAGRCRQDCPARLAHTLRCVECHSVPAASSHVHSAQLHTPQRVVIGAALSTCSQQ